MFQGVIHLNYSPDTKMLNIKYMKCVTKLQFGQTSRVKRHRCVFHHLFLTVLQA